MPIFDQFSTIITPLGPQPVLSFSTVILDFIFYLLFSFKIFFYIKKDGYSALNTTTVGDYFKLGLAIKILNSRIEIGSVPNGKSVKEFFMASPIPSWLQTLINVCPTLPMAKYMAVKINDELTLVDQNDTLNNWAVNEINKFSSNTGSYVTTQQAFNIKSLYEGEVVRPTLSSTFNWELLLNIQCDVTGSNIPFTIGNLVNRLTPRNYVPFSSAGAVSINTNQFITFTVYNGEPPTIQMWVISMMLRPTILGTFITKMAKYPKAKTFTFDILDNNWTAFMMEVFQNYPNPGVYFQEDLEEAKTVLATKNATTSANLVIKKVRKTSTSKVSDIKISGSFTSKKDLSQEERKAVLNKLRSAAVNFESAANTLQVDSSQLLKEFSTAWALAQDVVDPKVGQTSQGVQKTS